MAAVEQKVRDEVECFFDDIESVAIFSFLLGDDQQKRAQKVIDDVTARADPILVP